MNLDPDIYELARNVLGAKAPKAWIESLANDLQQTCDDRVEEYRDWCDEQESLRGYPEDEIAEKF